MLEQIFSRLRRGDFRYTTIRPYRLTGVRRAEGQQLNPPPYDNSKKPQKKNTHLSFPCISVTFYTHMLTVAASIVVKYFSLLLKNPCHEDEYQWQVAKTIPAGVLELPKLSKASRIQ